ncbi:MAG: spore germination protein [Ruminococcus sp.]|nr:spore germination protein [Ruminococcus sp.]
MQVDDKNYAHILLPKDADKFKKMLKEIAGDTMDLNVTDLLVSGHRCVFVAAEGMISTEALSLLVFRPLMEFDTGGAATADEVYTYLTAQSIMTIDRQEVTTFGELFTQLFSGFAIIFIDQKATAVSLGIQGYEKRGVESPTSGSDIYGAQDGFIEALRTNVSLVRRRIKSPKLKFELMQVGKTSKTDIVVAYISDKADKKIVNEVKRRLKSITLDTVFSSGYIEPFLESGRKTLFSSVDTTDRPDSFCIKLNEGKVGVLIDGTPFALIVPTIFMEAFRTVDDYTSRRFYVTYIRLIKYLSFFLAISLPGIYVAVASYHPEMLSHRLLLNLLAAEEATPYSVTAEALIITVMYEIMREAGIRLPKAVGGAVSIVGALIIGDAAVTSSLISAPLLIIIGLTATASFVIPSLNQQTSVLRFVYIIVGGAFGLFGISILSVAVIAGTCELTSFTVPYTAPITPVTKSALRDVFSRSSFKRLQRTSSTVEDLNGTDL